MVVEHVYLVHVLDDFSQPETMQDCQKSLPLIHRPCSEAPWVSQT